MRITLLTDFGTADGYVAAMKGAISAIAPFVIIDDAAHDIAAGDVAAGAWALAGYWRLYEPPVVHVAVVDPGVGSDRRGLVAEADGRLLVGPDNGLFTRVYAEAAHVRLFSIENADLMRPLVSSTFHGRDVFAPIAAHLAAGVPVQEVGPAITDALQVELPVARREHRRVHGDVVHVDRFGNLVTNIPAESVAAGARVVVCGRMCALVRTYADAEAGQPIALIGSRGTLEVSVRDGSAAALLDAARGAAVVVETD